jgi:pSer/pThr/pTyr-binding forkhead associated (FHA) protein
MPTTKITLTVVHGDLPKKEYVFAEPTRCIVGRADDCDIHAPTDRLYADISRHHGCLEVEPPAIRVRDLGSRNRMWINGHRIGQRLRQQLPKEADLRDFANRSAAWARGWRSVPRLADSQAEPYRQQLPRQSLDTEEPGVARILL